MDPSQRENKVEIGQTAEAGVSSLAAELQRLGIGLPPEQVVQLAAYRSALWRKNAVMNLTRHTTDALFASRDVFDSVAFAAALAPDEDVLDVGTGGGVPGIILAIIRPDVPITLCESVGKKASAVREIVEELKLPIAVHHARAEKLFEDGHTFDTLAIRAVARLDKLLTWFNPHWGHFHRMLALKGPRWVEERGEARHRGLLRELNLRRLALIANPDSGAESTLLEMTQKHGDG